MDIVHGQRFGRVAQHVGDALAHGTAQRGVHDDNDASHSSKFSRRRFPAPRRTSPVR
ncbi:Uncharacterised protein [Bordetella pertussis]|nr:Uncharacterised protein [Bordetella pertussis]